MYNITLQTNKQTNKQTNTDSGSPVFNLSGKESYIKEGIVIEDIRKVSC